MIVKYEITVLITVSEQEVIEIEADNDKEAVKQAETEIWRMYPEAHEIDIIQVDKEIG